MQYAVKNEVLRVERRIQQWECLEHDTHKGKNNRKNSKTDSTKAEPPRGSSCRTDNSGSRFPRPSNGMSINSIPCSIGGYYWNEFHVPVGITNIWTAGRINAIDCSRQSILISVDSFSALLSIAVRAFVRAITPHHWDKTAVHIDCRFP
jgi:hypothetical protein